MGQSHKNPDNDFPYGKNDNAIKINQAPKLNLRPSQAEDPMIGNKAPRPNKKQEELKRDNKKKK